jgi:ribosomal protein S27AE
LPHVPVHPVQADLTRAGTLYIQLAARVPKVRRAGDATGTAAGGSTPIDETVVDHMLALEQWVPWWNAAADWLLDPQPKIDLTKRRHVTCPECATGTLLAWPAREEIRCLACRAVWAGAQQWRRLGVVLGVHDDGRFGPRLPSTGTG